MSLRQRLGHWIAGGERAFVPPSYFPGTQRLGLDFTAGRPAAGALMREFMGWQAIAAAAIANRIQSLPLEVVTSTRDTDGTLIEEVLDDHPLTELLLDPNPMLSAMQILRVLTLWIVQSGEGYLLKVGDRLAITRELWPLEPTKMSLEVSETTAVTGYVYQAGQGRREVHYAQDEVIRFWNPDPAEIWAPVGNLAPQAIAYDAQKFLSETLRSYYQADATPRTALIANEQALAPTDDDRKRFALEWRERYSQRSGQARGVPAFLPPGFSVHEFESLDLSHQVTMLNHWRDQILMANGVPRSILGDVVDANRAAAETNQLVFDRYAVQPVALLIASGLTRSLARLFDPLLKVRFAKFISDDAELTLKTEAQDLLAKVRSVNQVREDRGLDPVPWGEQPVGTFSDQPYTGEEREPPASPFGGGGEPPRTRSVDLEWARQVRRERTFAGRMTEAMRAVFAEQAASVLERIAKFPRQRAPLFGLEDLFDDRAWGDVFQVHVEPIRRDAFRQSADEALRLLAPEQVFIFRDVMRRKLREQGAQLVAHANATTKEAIRQVLIDATNAGLGTDSIAKAVRQVFEDADRVRSRAIARTEVLKATQAGQLDSFGQAKVERKQWNTSRDDRVRDAHQIDGQVVALAATFTLDDGEAADSPGIGANGGVLSARNSINCRCFVTPVIEGA